MPDSTESIRELLDRDPDNPFFQSFARRSAVAAIASADARLAAPGTLRSPDETTWACRDSELSKAIDEMLAAGRSFARIPVHRADVEIDIGRRARVFADYLDQQIVESVRSTPAVAGSAVLYTATPRTPFEYEREQPHYETVLGMRCWVTPPSLPRHDFIRVLT